MRRNTALVAVALAVLLGTAGVAAALSPQSSGGDRTVAVAATGTAEASPDQAVLRVAVTAAGDDAGTVRDRLAENASSMRAALSEAGVDESQVTTVRFDISRNHRHEEDPTAPKYRGIHAFEITVRNVSKVGTYIDVAVENGASRVEDVRFTLSEEKRSDLRQDALREAMNDSRAQAETLAASGDLRLTGVSHVSTVEADYRPVHREVALAAGDAGGTSVSSGPVTVRVQVRVVYNATA